MNRCKNCKFWRNPIRDRYDPDPPRAPFKYCNKSYFSEKEALFDIEVQADDDTGLSVRLITHPEFGCVEWEQKKEN